tara:strand:- start:1702 stop:1821 length:120 start_codon:yes stop_codon:yes gene_type:complete
MYSSFNHAAAITMLWFRVRVLFSAFADLVAARNLNWIAG